MNYDYGSVVLSQLLHNIMLPVIIHTWHSDGHIYCCVPQRSAVVD